MDRLGGAKGIDGVWVFRRSRFAAVISPQGRFATRTIARRDVSPPRLFAVEMFCHPTELVDNILKFCLYF